MGKANSPTVAAICRSKDTSTTRCGNEFERIRWMNGNAEKPAGDYARRELPGSTAIDRLKQADPARVF
jgi:hypothetical protein